MAKEHNPLLRKANEDHATEGGQGDEFRSSTRKQSRRNSSSYRRSIRTRGRERPERRTDGTQAHLRDLRRSMRVRHAQPCWCLGLHRIHQSRRLADWRYLGGRRRWRLESMDYLSHDRGSSPAGTSLVHDLRDKALWPLKDEKSARPAGQITHFGMSGRKLALPTEETDMQITLIRMSWTIASMRRCLRQIDVACPVPVLPLRFVTLARATGR